MKVGTVQFDIKYCDKETNLLIIRGLIRNSGLNVVVLPELCTTGILFRSTEDIVNNAEEIPNGLTVRTLEDVARENQCTIIANVLEREQDLYYITSAIIGPDGYIGKQRKRHLTDTEKIFFSAGKNSEVFIINGIKVGVIICFDAWFPETCRELMLQGAQMICHCANIESELTMDIMKARALENKVFVVIANRIGRETNNNSSFSFRGESQIIDYQGKVLKKLGKDTQLMIADIDPSLTKKKSLEECQDIIGEIKQHAVFWQNTTLDL